MKTLISILLLVSVMLLGCTAKEWEVAEYHETLRQTNSTIVQSINAQTHEQANRRIDSMRYFSTAIIEAAKTEDPSDGATIAFAWGFASAQPDVVIQPNVQHPAPPVTDVDRVLAWTPIAQMAIPYLAPWLLDAGGNSGTSYVAKDQATIMVKSGNAGSYNNVSGAYGGGVGDSAVVNKHDDLILFNDGGGDIGSVMPYNDIPTTLPVEGGVPGELTEEWCNSQGLTLRESTGECITYEYKSNIENARLVGGDE